MNGMKQLFLILLSFICLSCGDGRHKGSQVAYSIDLDSALQVLPEMSDVECIPLETNDASLIADIDKVLYRNTTFYVFDKVGKKILLFDRQGNFLKSIHKIGQGPGEYTEPCDMDIDDEGNIYLSDWATQSIIVYKNGDENDYEVIRVGEYFLDFAVVGNSIYLGLVYQEGEARQNLVVWDKKAENITVVKKNLLLEGNKLPYRAKHYIFRSGNKAFYYERFNSYIYQLEEDRVDSCICFSSKKVPTKEDVKLWAQGNPMEQIQKSFQYIADVSACYETDDCISIVFQSIPVSYGIIDKKSGMKYYVSSKDAAVIPAKGICAIAERSLVSYFNPADENIEKVLQHIPDRETVEELRALSEDANPILLLFKFKNGK